MRLSISRTSAITFALSLLIAATLSGCVAVVAGGAATGVAVAHDRRSAGTVLDDQNVEFKSAAALAADEEINEQAHVSVTSYNYAVLLTGEAPNETLRSRAESLVLQVPLVRQVYNEIMLAEPSSLSQRAADSLLTAQVKGNLLKIEGLPDFDATRVKVVTNNRTVYLFGLLTRAEADAVVAQVSATSGVSRIVKLFEYPSGT